MTCNLDLGHPCDANDGEPCAECAAYLKTSAAEAWRAWQALTPEQRHPKRYGFDSREELEAAELLDAGRAGAPMSWTAKQVLAGCIWVSVCAALWGATFAAVRWLLPVIG